MDVQTTIVRLDATGFPPLEAERRIYSIHFFQLVEANSWEEIDAPARATAEALCVVSSPVTLDMIDHLPGLRVISRFGSGVDKIDVEAATRRRIAVVNVPSFCLAEVADHTMALLLGAARRIIEMDAALRAGRWRARIELPVRRIAGRRLGLVGFGRIAQEVARRAAAFGLRLQTCDPKIDAAAALRLGVEVVDFPALLETSDFVSLHTPLTPQTRRLMGAAELGRMHRDAILINTARGAVVDEEALAQALRDGVIAGAALDVYEGLDVFGPAPEVVRHPLLELPNVILTPHAAACSEEALDELMTSGARQAVDALAGRHPANCVNPQVLADMVGMAAKKD